MSRVQSQDNQWTQSTGQMNAQQQRFSQSYGNGSHVAYANPYASTGYQYGRLSAVRTPMLDSPRSPIEDGSALPYGNTGQASGGFHVYEDLSLYDLENRTPVHSRPGSRQDIYAATRPNTPGYQSANHGVSYLRPPQGYAPAYPSLPLENSTYDNTFHQADWYARSQQWAGRVVPTHYIQPRPAPEPYDPDITLRVISINVTNQAYFNLHLRHSFVFGPYFEAYCRQHGKRFQVDWEFIYRAEHNGQRVQAIIGWDTTPNLDEYPGIMMRNGDTIEIREINVAANEDLDVATDQGDAEPSEASSQSSDQEDHEEPEAEDDEEEPENGTDNVAELRELNRNLTVENDTLRADNIRLRSEIVMLRRGPVHPIGREAPTPVAAASSAISGAGSGSRSGRHKAAIASLRPPSPRPTSAEEAASDIRPAQKEVAQEPPHQSTSAGHARPNLDDTDDDADELAEELIFAGNGPLDSAPHMNESQIANPAMLNISPSRGLLDPLASELRHERTTSAWSNSSLSSISGSDDDEELR
ncbi:hypothetical protein BDV95DRAFT_604004 [Massariosphaeria phaeospora]|uniref:Uncharacterized protein n=1 Tax=Massariosphaeria phaeospora TaxID=100035 RepID=A0A7C8MRE4_9PLEO|nr:hypothetical protein BDV95DRAFT_604004 [Massariosphaeria phaeospora]